MGARARLSAIGGSWAGLDSSWIRQIRPFVEQRTLEMKRVFGAQLAYENFRKNLLLLNDVLAQAEFGDKYWIFAGLLLGWAREGRVLARDCWDADFAYWQQDRAAFDSAAHCLVRKGFQFKQHWYNNAGVRTQSVFIKDNAKFEFFEMMPVGAAAEYFMYGTRRRIVQEARCNLFFGELEPLHFLDRTWNKPRDHEASLMNLYGNWRVPNPSYDYMQDQQDIVEIYAWHGRWDKQLTD
jgi:hypothetical protein